MYVRRYVCREHYRLSKQDDGCVILNLLYICYCSHFVCECVITELFLAIPVMFITRLHIMCVHMSCMFKLYLGTFVLYPGN